MHALLLTFGTDGDVIPYVGLGTRLHARGHRVTLAANEHFRELAAQQGFEFQTLCSDGKYRELLANPDIWHPTRSAILGARWGKSMTRTHYELISQLAADPDTVLIANPGILAARLVQEKLGRPLASIVLQPWLIPSVHAMPTMPGWFRLPQRTPPLLVAGYIRAVNLLGDLLLAGHINAVRAELGLPRVRNILRWWFSPQLMIGLFPEWYGPPQQDWPPQLRLAGFPLFDGRPEAPLEPRLLDFCREGEPPIAFTLGTGMMHAAEFFRAAIEACRLLGRRGILLTQFPELLPAELPPHAWHCRFAPFVQLFPQCAAVVHHGGIGTAAKALSAGVPQLMLPLAFDQMDNARRVHDLGVGDSLPPKNRGPQHLAAALARLLQPEVQDRARELAQRHFPAADSLAVAVDLIEDLAPNAAGSPCERADVAL